jgi:hypothetical protein
MVSRVLIDPPELAGHLWNVADATARSHGFQFDPETETQIRGLIGAGVAKLTQDKRAGERARVSKMVDDTVRLVEMLIQNSPHREFSLAAPGTYSLARSDFAAGMRWFCPCYPFC